MILFTFWNSSCSNTSLFSKLKELKGTCRFQDSGSCHKKPTHVQINRIITFCLIKKQDCSKFKVVEETVKTKQALSAQEVPTFERLFWLCYLASISKNSVKQPFQHISNWHCPWPQPSVSGSLFSPPCRLWVRRCSWLAITRQRTGSSSQRWCWLRWTRLWLPSGPPAFPAHPLARLKPRSQPLCSLNR